jgi:hypothetical protein
VAVESEELKGDGIPLEVVLYVLPQHYSHLKVFRVRGDCKQNLRIEVETVVIVVNFLRVVCLEVEFAVNALRVGVDFSIPTERD